MADAMEEAETTGLKKDSSEFWKYVAEKLSSRTPRSGDKLFTTDKCSNEFHNPWVRMYGHENYDVC